MKNLIPPVPVKITKVVIPENLLFQPTIPLGNEDRANLKDYFEFLGLPELGKQVKHEKSCLTIRLKTYRPNMVLLPTEESSILNVLDFEDEDNIEEECIGKGKVFDLRFEFMFSPPNSGEGYVDYVFQFKTRDRVDLVINTDVDIIEEHGRMLKDFMKYMSETGGFSETTESEVITWLQAKDIFQSMLTAIKNIS